MKLYHLKCKIVIVLCFISTVLFSQNYIYNSGFEEGDAQGAYNAHSTSNTIEFLDHWEKADDEDYHSPDWRRKGAPSYNFVAPNANVHDYTKNFPSMPPYVYYYPEYFPYNGYGMLGLYNYELIQQKYKASDLASALSNSPWNSITVKMKIRMSNASPPTTRTLKVFLAKRSMNYKQKQFPCEDEDFRTYNSVGRIDLLTIPNVGTTYPRGEWHTISQTYTLPYGLNIGAYDWIVIDMIGDGCPKDYLHIDDVELVMGCPDECSATDGNITNPMSSNVIHSSSTVVLNNVANANSVRLEVFDNGGAIAVFDQTASCTNGIDHNLHWDGTSAGGAPLANAIYQYRVTIQNDCGQQIFTGSILKQEDYAGTNVTNFNLPCLNGVNVTPEPCCWPEPDLFIYNRTLVGPEPGWTSFIMPGNIWAATLQPNSSDPVVVEHDARVLFRAGQQVTLAEGFSTKAGAVFCAEIAPCARPEGSKMGNSSPLIIIEGEEDKEERDLPVGTKSMKVYPNPTTHVVHLDLSPFYKEEQAYLVRVNNVMGEQLYSFEATTPIVTVDLQKYASGIYYIQVYDGKEKHLAKIIKE